MEEEEKRLLEEAKKERNACVGGGIQDTIWNTHVVRCWEGEAGESTHDLDIFFKY